MEPCETYSEAYSEAYSETFYYYYYSIINQVIKFYQKWKVVGACDECVKYLYASNIFYQMKGVPRCSLRLQYCGDDCLKIARSKYDYLNTIEFTQDLDEESRQTVSKISFMETRSFMLKYPWTLKEKPPALLDHIYTLRTMYELCPKECTDETKLFLTDVETYGIA